jgi:iron complex outermembrane receptor protein
MPKSLPFRPGRVARAITVVLAGVGAAAAFAQTVGDAADTPRPTDDGIRIGTIVITGKGDRLGAGQILKEDAVKGRSTVTRAATEKDRATGNSFQALALLPGVNTFSHDATGLFGGGITVRGFGGDQLGLTINGVPVNDSGNFAVYPMEYADQENLCTQSLAQGNPDVESPHVGASGGSINTVSCDPEDKRRIRVSQTLGGLKLSRSFVRLDSGRFADDKAKVFASFSHSEADKWKGKGGANRNHIDAAFSLDPTPDAHIVGSVLYNNAVNNNFGTLSLAQLEKFGYGYDFSTSFTPGHLPPVNGTVQKETGPSPQYYALATNPFENAIVSVSGSLRLAEATYLKVQPYYWYGYGTGGVQQRALSETGFLNTTTGKIGAGTDLNGDGDTLDTVIVANSSVTRTQRPGVTAEISHVLGDHQLKFGLWYERAQHRQTGPAVAVDAEGNSSDVWLRDGLLLRPDGTPFESRDWRTVSTAYQAYVADTISVLGNQGVLQLGLRAPSVERNFTNHPSEAGGNSLNAYTIKKSYSDLLPQVGLRYNFTKEQQVFANIGKNFRAPPNFAFAPTGNNVTFSGGVATLSSNVKAETSIATDVGYRYQGQAITLSATAFHVDFSNRQSNAYDPVLDKSVYTNAGKTKKEGLEFEAGTAVYSGFSAYASLTLQKETLKSDVTVAKNQLIPLSGKQYTLTPNTMVGTALQYASGPYYVRVKVKHTGKQYATLMNDEQVPAYTCGDLDAGYKFADIGAIKNPMVRLNISNIGNARYRNPSSASVVNAKPVGSTAAGTVFYYLGAPRLFSVTLSADFQ